MPTIARKSATISALLAPRRGSLGRESFEAIKMSGKRPDQRGERKAFQERDQPQLIRSQEYAITPAMARPAPIAPMGRGCASFPS